MNSDLIRAQLQVMRSQLDAMHATVDAMVIALNGQPPAAPAAVQGACPTCGAPEEQQQDKGTLNDPALKRCAACGHEYQGNG